MIFFKALGGILLVMAAPLASAPIQRADLHLVDLTDDYDRIWSETQALPSTQRAAYFRTAFATLIPGLYDSKRLAPFGVTPEKYDEFLSKMLETYPGKREAVRKAASEFQIQFTPALASFETEFGAMRGFPPIYLVNSHNEFDGGTRDLPEGVRLLFGADMIAKLYAGKPIQPFFHHELFHLRHSRSFPECPQIWCNLWVEGLAVHVASTLNPGANDDALLLTSPEPLRPAVEANKAAAVCAILSRLDSEKPEDYAPLFMGGTGDRAAPGLPRRFGYYVGMLVAQDLGRTRTLKELAALPHAEVRPLVEASLRKMAACS